MHAERFIVAAMLVTACSHRVPIESQTVSGDGVLMIVCQKGQERLPWVGWETLFSIPFGQRSSQARKLEQQKAMP